MITLNDPIGLIFTAITPNEKIYNSWKWADPKSMEIRKYGGNYFYALLQTFYQHDTQIENAKIIQCYPILE